MKSRKELFGFTLIALAFTLTLSPEISSSADHPAVRREGNQVIFRDATLAAVIAEFNRFNASPKFHLTDAGAAGQLISGVFNIDSPESFVLVLSRLEDLAVKRKGNNVFVSARSRKT